MKINTAKPSAIQKFFFFFLILLMWFLAGWNTDNADLDNYITEYSWIQDGGIILTLHLGYSMLQYIFVAFGAEYFTYRIIVYGIGLVAISFFIYRWAPRKILLTLLIFLVLHFLRDVVQTRNFLASIFILFSIDCLYKERSVNIYLVALLVCISICFHTSFFPFLILLLADKKKWAYWKVLFVCFLLSFLFQMFYLSGGLYLFPLLLEGTQEKIDEIMENLPRYAIYSSTILMIFNGLCLNYYNRQLHKITPDNTYYINNVSNKRLSYITNNINALCNIIIVFTVINGAFFSRLFVNIVFINTVYFVNIIINSRNNKSTMCILLLLYVAVFSYCLRITPYDLHFFSVVTNNSILH